MNKVKVNSWKQIFLSKISDEWKQAPEGNLLTRSIAVWLQPRTSSKWHDYTISHSVKNGSKCRGTHTWMDIY